MRKFIKKISKTLTWTLACFALLLVLLPVVLNTPVIQHKLTNHGVQWLESTFGNNYSYSKVKIRLFNKIELDDFLVRDLKQDTLLYASKFSVNFPGMLRRFRKEPTEPFHFQGMDFEDAYFRIYTDSLTNNLKFIIDTLKSSKDTTIPPKTILIDKFRFINSKIVLYQYDSVSIPYGVNLSALEFNDVNLTCADIRMFTDTTDFTISKFEFEEQSGFRSEKFTANVHLDMNHLQFADFYFRSNYSEMFFSKFNFRFRQFTDFGGGNIFKKIKLDFHCKNSSIYGNDLGYFTKVFRGIKQYYNFSGKLNGTLANLNGENLQINYGESTVLRGEFDMMGLPNGSNTFLIFDLDELRTNATDIKNIQLPGDKKINVPDRFRGIETYKYTGNFTGFFDDFVSFGMLETEVGNVETDISFAPDSNNIINFAGLLRTDGFGLGNIVGDSEKIGNIAFDMRIDGTGRVDGGFDLNMVGDVSSFEILGYNYKDINVDGEFSENRFNGYIKIYDPNARVDFQGLIDLSASTRIYNFSANVLQANLHTLNINKSDPDYSASFLIEADASGNNIDELNGNIRLINSLFSKSDDQIQVYDLLLNIQNDSIQNSVNLESDFMIGEISGKYKLSKLVNEYLFLLNTYLPSLALLKDDIQLDASSSFKYSFDFKNCEPVFRYFSPDYSLAPHTKISGALSRSDSLISSIHIESPRFVVKRSKWNDLVINSVVKSNELKVDLGCSLFNISERIDLDNFSVNASLDSNKIDFTTKWINWDSSLYKGIFMGQIALVNKPYQKLQGDININHSTVIINDTVWQISPCELFADSARIKVHNLKLQHEDEYFTANGILSESIEDSLFCSFNSFNFGHLNYFTRSEAFKFAGILNGKANLQGKTKTVFLADLNIDNLALNDQLIGDTKATTSWQTETQSILVNADVHRGLLKTLEIDGYYYPSDDGYFDLGLTFNKFKLDFINPYLDNVFDDVRGLATGRLSLKGKASDPYLNGNLNMQRAAFSVDYLKTRYHFTSNIGFLNNNILFENIMLTDKYGNQAGMNGVIRVNKFKEFALNLDINANNFLVLNTSLEDNSYLYGTVFSTGLIRVDGPTENLKFNITAKTEPGSQFFIPLSDSDELDEFAFVKQKVNNDTVVVESQDDYDVNLAGLQLDFALNITPETDVQIIFDQTMGDIIKARGKGDLKISINSLGDFQIVGDYVIEEGDYLFTLQDVLINRKFNVEKGSSLRWVGDPSNALIDIKTYYQTDASLYDLFPSEYDAEGKGAGSAPKPTVHCRLMLNGELERPEISYDVFLPNTEQNIRDKVATKLGNQDELTKQFLSLLILHKFFYSGELTTTTGYDGALGVNTTELLTSQLNNWLSQISDDFDLGVNYRPGQKTTSDEVEFMLSTQLLNDRLIIDGSVDYRTKAEINGLSNFVGEVEVDYKITENGKIRAKAYNRANEYFDLTESDYTQGVGFFYTEEFNKFSDLWKKKKKKKDKDELVVPFKRNAEGREEED